MGRTEKLTKKAKLKALILGSVVLCVLLLVSFNLPLDLEYQEQEFTYNPSGQLLEGSGVGVTDNTIYNSTMRFPIQNSPAYCNSQVYGYGGKYGPYSPKALKDERNYVYPWVDNFCEKRSNKKYKCCPGKIGHLGQDIRPATFHDKAYIAVAPEDVLISHIGSYSVNLKSLDGRMFYKYLHLDKKSLFVKKNQVVKKGDPIGYVSDEFGKTSTSVHLHFEMRVSTKSENSRPTFKIVSPYSTLVHSYKELLKQESINL